MNHRIAFASVAAALCAATSANAAPVSADATANATIVAPNQVSATRSLEFGSIARPTNSGATTVIVASAATGTATPSVSGSNGFVPTPGQARAATFRLIGTNGQTYSITTNSLSFTGASGNLTNIASETPVAASGTLNTLPSSGQDDLFIGGRFDITSTTALQTYTGTLSLTVNFN
ncbi:MAG: DUF4402 domain-containing protein [Phenylobacterium sp.]|uniref:DUF4402 domain-containing protein n=1 Tax=Phenylobacterium sp. TaxID=1871053 RepID=UPI001A377E4E|nr:DUF4402 domain-containing protein [Phenylobacterium sp.]MBL8773196.1 DUF4402 domain-containing protein [Phenylobacterium sp.]